MSRDIQLSIIASIKRDNGPHSTDSLYGSH